MHVARQQPMLCMCICPYIGQITRCLIKSTYSRQCVHFQHVYVHTVTLTKVIPRSPILHNQHLENTQRLLLHVLRPLSSLRGGIWDEHL